MTELFLKIFNMSFSASWIVLAVLVLRLGLRKAPRWVSVLLWGIVAARLVCPVSIESALSLIPSAEVVSPGILTDATPQITTGIPAVNSVVNPILTESFAPDPAASVSPMQVLIPVCAWVWLAGAAVMGIYTAVSYFALRRKVMDAVRLRENIYRSDRIASPFVLGIGKPRIYLPANMDPEHAAHVIAHEQTHIRRRDHWWKPLGFGLLTLHWFNPLMWVAYVLLCRDIELACDEKVIARLGRDARADYSEALLTCSVSRPAIAACPLAFGEVGVRQRVKNVLSYRKPAFWIVVTALLLCAIAAVCFLTDPKTPAMDVLPLMKSRSFTVGLVVYEEETGPHHDTAVSVAVTENMELLSRAADGWHNQGNLRETELTQANFDALFPAYAQAAEIRDRNADAWELTDGDHFCYLLQQRDGSVYMAVGNAARSRITGFYWLDTGLHPDVGMTAVSGERMVPVLSFPGGTAIGNFVDQVHWLDIDLGAARDVTFVLRRDGYELTDCHYTLFDAETFQIPPHHAEHGQPEQRYLFEGVDQGREYVVVAVEETGPDAPIYCFGVRFAEASQSQLYVLPGGAAEWVNRLEDESFWQTYQETTLAEYPGVTFRWNYGTVEAITDTGSLELFTGMPVRNVFFCDLTGDTKPELCATVSFGSGWIDTHVVVYDYAARQEYTLWHRGVYDYQLRLEDGRLLCDQYDAQGGSPGQLLATGELTLAATARGPRLGILGGEYVVVDITDWAEAEQLPTDEAVEVFYTDAEFEYSFPSIRSHLVIVTYLGAETEDVRTALASGRIRIEDLFAFGIHYYKTPRTDLTLAQLLAEDGVTEIRMTNGRNGRSTAITDPARIADIVSFTRSVSGWDQGSSQGYYGFCYSLVFYSGSRELLSVTFGDDDSFYCGYASGDTYPTRYGLIDRTTGSVINALRLHDGSV